MSLTTTFRKVLVVLMVALASASAAWASSFKVENTDNVFTITRLSNTSATETVNYRTVSLSALAGIHFTAKSGTLQFDADHNERTITVTEANGTISFRYRYQNGTTRSYRFEVLDVNGFQLAYKDRSITYDDGLYYKGDKVSNSITDLVYFNGTSYASGLNSSKYVDVSYRQMRAGAWRGRVC